MYKLNQKSNSAKFYEWVWKTKVTNFKTMCPYFWGYVITITLLPLILLLKFIYYLLPAKKTLNKGVDYIAHSDVGEVVGGVFKPNMFWYVVGKFIKWLFITLVSIVLIAGLIGLLYNFYLYPLKGLVFIGAIAVLVFALYVFIEIGSKLLYPFKLIGNMIYSLYKNVCPIIKWEK